MTTFPVHYAADKPPRFQRIQLVIRLVAFVALGLLGLSLGALYIIAYVALPAYAAARLAGGRDAHAYLRDDGPRIARLLRWFAAIYAWFALVTDRLPARSPDETVHVDIEPTGQPTAAGALWRLITGLPSALVLALLGFVAGLVWLWGALTIVFQQRVGDGTHAFLTGVQRWSIRLLAYQAAIVDEYPPFSFADEHPQLPAARVSR